MKINCIIHGDGRHAVYVNRNEYSYCFLEILAVTVEWRLNESWYDCTSGMVWKRVQKLTYLSTARVRPSIVNFIIMITYCFKNNLSFKIKYY